MNPFRHPPSEHFFKLRGQNVWMIAENCEGGNLTSCSNVFKFLEGGKGIDCLRAFYLGNASSRPSDSNVTAAAAGATEMDIFGYLHMFRVIHNCCVTVFVTLSIDVQLLQV